MNERLKAEFEAYKNDFELIRQQIEKVTFLKPVTLLSSNGKAFP